MLNPPLYIKDLIRAINRIEEPAFSAEQIQARLGISTMSLLLDPNDPSKGVDEAALRRAVEVGARKIEVAADYGPSHFPYRDLAATRRTRSFYEDNGAEIYSVHSPFGSDSSSWDMDDVKQLIDAMGLIGAKVLLLHFAMWGKSRWQPCLDVIGKLVEWCRPHGIWISIETDTDMIHDANFVDWFDFPQVGICCDTGHTGRTYGEFSPLTLEGNVYTCFSTATHKLNHLHLSDVAHYPLPQGRRRKREHWSPGRGNHNWAAILRVLKAMDYPGCFMFEIWTEDDERFDRLAEFPDRLVAGELGTIM